MDYLFNQEKNLELYGEEKKREGIEIGKEQGIEIGKEQGKMLQQMEIAKNMKDNDYSLEEIMKMTGLSKEEIEQL